MPLYICNAVAGAIDDDKKQAIAQDITRIHCEVTGAPPRFVHSFFLEDAAQPSLNGKSASLLGSIRAGRTTDQKTRLLESMLRSISQHTGLDADDIAAVTTDVPASWVMEGGEIFPEPGEEAEWLERHDAKQAVHEKA